MRCDEQACAVASGQRNTYIYRCHAGLTEAVTPLYVGDVLVGYLLFGHVFTAADKGQGIDTVLSRCRPLQVDERSLRKALSDAEPHNEAYVQSAAQILHAVASYLIMERMAVLQNEKLAVRLDAMISSSFAEPLSAAALCEALGIGKTQLYKLSKELYGCGVAERIRQLRMDRAKTLLKDQSKTISEISERCGYSDYNYFISVFNRTVGMPPHAWRKKNA